MWSWATGQSWLSPKVFVRQWNGSFIAPVSIRTRSIPTSYFEKRFYKFPSSLRRAAIEFVKGQVSSFLTRYRL